MPWGGQSRTRGLAGEPGVDIRYEYAGAHSLCAIRMLHLVIGYRMDGHKLIKQ
jgi:hypothetical protein